MRYGSKKDGQMVRPSHIGSVLLTTWIERMQISNAKNQLAAQQGQSSLHRIARELLVLYAEPSPLVLIVT
jgi:hypothetical protein